MTLPAERQFTVYRRGEIREQILIGFREHLRGLVDPSTSQVFTEDTIRLVTAKGSRFYNEADSIDVVGLGHQKRDEFLAQQMRIGRAGHNYLVNFHGEQWGEEPLGAFGGSGTVLALGSAGTLWQGSTTVPDPFAVFGTDPAGNRYQVLISGTANASGQATLTLQGIDGGSETNIDAGTVITWANPPPGSEPTATVSGTGFTGGDDAEDDAAFADRLGARVRHKPAAGNWAHFRAFAREANVSVEDTFVYPAALYAGSVIVCVTQKRGTQTGPNARVPNIGVLADVTAFLVPPNSPVIPTRVFVLVVPPVAQPTNAVMQLAQLKASEVGWSDQEPFPPINTGSTAVTITTVNSQTDIEITASGVGLLPGAVAGPLSGVNLMVWDPVRSVFESLQVLTVEDTLAGGIYNVLLAAPPTTTLAVGQYISPDMARRETLTAGVEAYFDSLGPGEVIDLTADPRSARAFRHPSPSEEAPSRAGQQILTFVSDALGSPLANSLLASISSMVPTVPADPVLGPSLIVPDNVAVYDLP